VAVKVVLNVTGALSMMMFKVPMLITVLYWKKVLITTGKITTVVETTTVTPSGHALHGSPVSPRHVTCLSTREFSLMRLA
jgi:hypothetical protein